MLVVPDPEKVGSSAPQDIPSLGVTVPCNIEDTPYSQDEWAQHIENGVPVALHDEAAGEAEEENA